MIFKFNLYLTLCRPLIYWLFVGTIGQREINSEILQGYYWLSCSCKGHIRNQNGGNSFSPKGDLTAPETSTFYKNHGDNKLGFICAHQPEMASVKPSQHRCSFRSTLLTRSISPGHRKHKQHLRFQQLQQNKRRAVKFWSLLGFCAKSNFVLRGWVCLIIVIIRFPTDHQIPEFGPSYIVWSCYLTLVNFIFCFLLIPEKRLSYFLRLSSISESEKTQISLQQSWNLGFVKFYMNSKFVPQRNPK